MFMSVLFPLPEAPITATYSPRVIAKLTSRSATTEISPASYRFSTFSSERRGRRTRSAPDPDGAPAAARSGAAAQPPGQPAAQPAA